MGATLRNAERRYAAEGSPEALDALQATRGRCGLTPLCDDCGEPGAAVREGAAQCPDCYVSGLKHGHRHVGHDEPLADCPLCPGAEHARDWHDSVVPLVTASAAPRAA